MATEKHPKRQLTDKQRIFIEEYLMCFNAVQAYIKAGYSTNCKKATLHKNAYSLLNSEAIQAEIQEQISLVRDNGEALKVKLEKFFTTQIENGEIAMKDRLKSAELLARMLGAFDNKVTLSGEDLSFNFNISEATPEEE